MQLSSTRLSNTHQQWLLELVLIVQVAAQVAFGPVNELQNNDKLMANFRGHSTADCPPISTVKTAATEANVQLLHCKITTVLQLH